MARLVSWRHAPLPRDPGYVVFANGSISGVYGKVLSQHPVKGGYLRVPLRDGRKHLVQRLVLEAFIGPCPKGCEASHEDGDPTNNHLDNLRWRTKNDNCKLKTTHGTNFTRGNCKLTEEDVLTIKARVNSGDSISDVSKDYPHVSRSTVSHAYHGRTWKS